MLRNKSDKKNRDYIAEIVVDKNSTSIGKTIVQAKLRNLEDIFLVELLRGNNRITPVPPTFELQAGDILFFAGNTSGIAKLVKESKGLSLSDRKNKARSNNSSKIYEAVVPFNSTLVEKNCQRNKF